jgi:hypothetical protein
MEYPAGLNRNPQKGITARRNMLATMLVLDALFDHIQQISSHVEIIGGLVQCSPISRAALERALSGAEGAYVLLPPALCFEPASHRQQLPRKEYRRSDRGCRRGTRHHALVDWRAASRRDGTSPQITRQLAGKRMLFGLSPRILPMVVGCGSRCGVPASGALMTRRSQGPRRPCSRAVLPHGRS